MARPFDARNAERPAWWPALVARVPACFSAESWNTYLDGVARQARGDSELRKHLERGGAPNHCIGCSSAGRIKAHVEGRCHPVKGSK